MYVFLTKAIMIWCSLEFENGWAALYFVETKIFLMNRKLNDQHLFKCFIYFKQCRSLYFYLLGQFNVSLQSKTLLTPNFYTVNHLTLV